MQMKKYVFLHWSLQLLFTSIFFFSISHYLFFIEVKLNWEHTLSGKDTTLLSFERHMTIIMNRQIDIINWASCKSVCKKANTTTKPHKRWASQASPWYCWVARHNKSGGCRWSSRKEYHGWWGHYSKVCFPILMNACLLH